MTGVDPGSARPQAVSPARALLVVVACGLFAGASFLLARADGPSAPSLSGTRATVETLRARPSDGAAFRELAAASEARGDRATARRLYSIAVRRNPRDAQAQLWLANAALANHDPQMALPHLDAALRVAPEDAGPALRGLLDAPGDSATQAALAAQLAGDPPWRDRLPALLAASDPVSALSLLSALSVRPLRPAELALRVSLLESLGRPAEARAAWSAALPAPVRRLDGRIFDGGFEYGEGPEPYGWRLPSSPEAIVGLETSHVVQGRSALSVVVQGRAVLLPDISQHLVLASGAYTLVLQADSALTGSGRAFAWVLSCSVPAIELAHLALPRQSGGWQRFAIGFTVPAQCPTQTLQLVHEGRNLAERSLSGRLGVDAMQILPGPG